MRGPRFESHREQLRLSRRSLRYVALGSGCAPSLHCFNLTLHPSGVAVSSTSFDWGKSGDVTSAGWQVTLCDPTWHVSFRSDEAGLHYSCEPFIPRLLSLQCRWHTEGERQRDKHIQRPVWGSWLKPWHGVQSQLQHIVSPPIIQKIRIARWRIVRVMPINAT